MDWIHMCALGGYHVLASDATILHIRGVDVLYWDVPHFQAEAFHTHGLNMTRFQLASVSRIWFIFGCYLAPNDASTINRVVAAIGQRPLWRCTASGHQF